MRNRPLVMALAALLALSAGCSSPAEAPEGGYQLYYSALDDPYAAQSLACEPYGGDAPAEPVPALVDALLDGPTVAGLTSPFPEGVRLLDWSLEDGVLHLDLSEQYGGLTGVDLTVADACLALTLCQVEGVASVYVTVEGREIPYRAVQLLTPDSVSLSDGEGETTLRRLTLWYPRVDGSGLGGELREFSAGDTLLQDVLTSWAEGPRQEGLGAALPQGAEVRSVSLQDGLCSVDLSQAFLDGLPASREQARLAIYALVNTLAGVEGVEQVQLLVEGEPVGQALSPNDALSEPAS